MLKLNSFDNRLIDGNMGEACGLRALEAQVIPNLGFGLGPQVTEKEWNQVKWGQIKANKINGDLWFVDVTDFLVKYIDVKNTTWIAEESLKNFRLDNSYYLLNAFTWDTNKYFLVRADQFFRDWVFANCEMIEIGKDKTRGYIIDYDKLPVEHFNSRNGRIPEMDPVKFRKIVGAKYEENDENGIPYKKRFAR